MPNAPSFTLPLILSPSTLASKSRRIGIGLVMGLLSLIVLDVTLPGGLLGGMEHLARHLAQRYEIPPEVLPAAPYPSSAI